MVDYKKYFIETPKKYELCNVFSNTDCFNALTNDLLSQIKDPITKVVAIETYGLILGGALAQRLNVGLVPIRKQGKLLTPTYEKSCIDYEREKTLEIAQDALTKDDIVLLVDDWIETGGQMRAAIDLIKMCGARVDTIAVIGTELEKIKDISIAHVHKA